MNNKHHAVPVEVEEASWNECNRRINEKYMGRRSNSTTTERFEDGVLHSQTVIVHKQASNMGIILLTAVVFLLIGALIAGGILTAGLISSNEFHNLLVNNTKPTIGGSNIDYNQNASSTPSGDMNMHSSPMAAIYNRVVSGVVLVKSYYEKAGMLDLSGVGTGFFLTADGYIMTNAHVIEDAEEVKIELYDGTILDAAIIGRDVRNDVAVLHVDGNGYNALAIGNSEEAQIGDFVMAIGHPTGEQLRFTATFGIIGSLNRRVNIESITNEYIQIDAAINPGNSGGPLFDMNGSVIGVNSAKTLAAGYDEYGETIAADGLGFAIPINKAITIADEIIKNNGNVQRAGIGLSVIAIDKQRAEYYGIPQGMLVYKVIKNGPAHEAGLYANDIITRIDGKAILESDEFVDIVLKHSVGDSIEIEFWRDGEFNTCTIVTGDFNEIGEEVLDNAYGGEEYGIK